MHWLIISLLSLYVSYFMYSFIIPNFRKKKIGQNIRLDGPKSHYYKKGTPTFGGVIIIINSLITLFLLVLEYFNIFYFIDIILIIISIMGFSFIGFIDDYRNIKYHHNEGIKPITKLILQILMSFFVFLILIKFNVKPSIKLFNVNINLNFLYFFWVLLVMLSTTNAINITDGIDGLASGVSVIILILFLIISFFKGQFEVCLIISAFITGILGFMFFNVPPAKIFMGNTGSMAVGSLIGIISLLTKSEIILVISCIFPIVETLSVILQVLYFKITKGKRLLPMSPIHHSLELWGLNEWMIDLLAWSITIISSSIAFLIGVNYVL